MTMEELNKAIATARAANIRRASQYKSGMLVLCAPALFTSATAGWLPGVIVSIHPDGRSAKVKLHEFNSIVEVWITAIKAA